jgi:hypothetical protein
VARALGNANPRPFVTVTGTTIGTPAYMAPEQALGDPLSPATDLYSLGIIVWEALAGHAPFESRETPMAVLYRQVNEVVPAIDTVRDDVDPALSTWLGTLLAKRPASRFQSAEAAWDQLEEVLIRLLGPRWRRDAPIRDAAPRREGRPTPVTPTITDPPPGEPPASTLAGAPPAFTRARVAPATAPARTASAGPPASAAGATVVHPARRHAGAMEPAAEAAAASHRWTPTLLLAAGALALAAIAGGVVGGLTGGGGARTRTTTAPAVALADAVRPVVSTLSAAQRAGVSRLDAGRTPGSQAAAAAAVATAYAAAERRVQALPSAQAALPAARSLDAALAGVEADWRSLAAAAGRGSRGTYALAANALARGEHGLAGAVLAAERGR